jgi:hypothetical protein
MASPTTLFIVEGERRDVRFLNSLIKRFLPQPRTVKTLILPAARNIYMLYRQLEEDDFQTDIVEVLRESNSTAANLLEDLCRDDIDEIYLFFDFDPHHFKKMELPFAIQQISEILKLMLQLFDNETEFGRLYISYPMIEALYDYQRSELLCNAHSRCFLPFESLSSYKRLSGENNPIANEHEPQWLEVLNVFALRIACLFEFNDFNFNKYRSSVTPLTLYKLQEQLLSQDKVVFGLSSLPEFLFDYFGEEFWKSNVDVDELVLQKCKHRLQPTFDSPFLESQDRSECNNSNNNQIEIS